MANNDDSKSGYTSLKPAQVELSGAGQSKHDQPPEPPATGLGNYKGLLQNKQALIIAAVVALLVFSFFLLPRLVGTPNVSATHTAAMKRAQNLTTQAGRYEETLAAKREIQGRSLVQDEQISAVAELQLELEQDQVTLWAEEQFNAAVALAQAADAHYQRREWRHAGTKYRAAEQAFVAIVEIWPTVLADKIQLVEDHFVARRLPEAKAAIAELKNIRPDLPSIADLEARLELYPKLFELLREAEALLDLNQIQEATDKLLEAASIDAEYPDVVELSRRILGEALEDQFQQAMASGLQAIAAKRYADAVTAFRKAVQLNADDAAARDGLTDAEARFHNQRLGELRTQAKQAEQAEKWREALARYQEAQKIVSNIQAINQGLERSKKRLTLDTKLTALLASAKHFASEEQREHGWEVLELSRKIRPKGPRFRKQLSQLEAALRLAATPIVLTIESDNRTAIEIYKLGHFGSFKKRNFDLEPGEYTVRGTRRGYRDVLHIFELEAGLPRKTVAVRCEEKI